MPGITREMIVTIQALVILFTGAMGDMLRASRLKRSMRGSRRRQEHDDAVLRRSDADPRLDRPPVRCRCCSPALRGLYSERAGIVDIGLEGKLLAAAFAAAAASAVLGSAWWGLLAGIGGALMFSAIHGIASINLKGNQTISGVALNFLAAGLTTFLGQSWFHRGGYTPQLQPEQRFTPSRCPSPTKRKDVPSSARSIGS